MTESVSRRNLWTFWALFLCLAGGFPGTMSANTPTTSRTSVVRATDTRILTLFMADSVRVRHLFQSAFAAYSGSKDPAVAWIKWIKKSDRIGIKINTAPGPVMSTRPALVEAVIESLKSAGIPSNHIIVFDRYSWQMESAGYHMGTRDDGVRFDAAVPSGGYQAESVIDLPIPGQLIWGDFEFRKQKDDREDQISTHSYFNKIFTDQIDKMIDIGVPMNDPDLGLYGCMLNSSLSLIDNFRRLQRSSFTREDSLASLFGRESIRKKTFLHIMDGILAQFGGGPGFDPNFCWPLQTIYLSQDAIALDTLVLEQINAQRPKAELPPIQSQVEYLKTAADLGLGVQDKSQMEITDVSP